MSARRAEQEAAEPRCGAFVPDGVESRSGVGGDEYASVMAEAQQPSPGSLVSVDLGAYAKPVNTLIKRVAEAIGGTFRPGQIERVARAEAKAAIIKANAEIQITDLHRRAANRWLDEEAAKQKNMEAITERALPDIREDAQPEKMDQDWITNFFDKSRIISSEDVQGLWSRLLAGEANKPGSYSRRTVNLLADLDPSDAVLFGKLCGFLWMVGREPTPLVFDSEAEIYTKSGITFTSLHHLETLGLVSLNDLGGFIRKGFGGRAVVSYGARAVRLTPNGDPPQIGIGKVIFSQAGMELASIADGRVVDGFFEYVLGQWKGLDPTPLDPAGKSIVATPVAPPPAASPPKAEAASPPSVP